MNFRAKLLLAMTLVAVAITGLGWFIVERKVSAETEHDLELSFQAELNALHATRQVRQAALAERCRSLVGRPRILAALEDDALDLLYSSAKDELRDLMHSEGPGANLLRAKFYRFLDSTGRVILPEPEESCGGLTDEESNRLNIKGLPQEQQVGFLWHHGSRRLLEVFAIPIVSTETGEIISSLVIGLAPSAVLSGREEMLSGILVDKSLHIAPLHSDDQVTVREAVSREIATGKQSGKLRMTLAGSESRLFFNLLNAGSSFSPAYEICVYPLATLLARQQTLRRQAAGICGLLLVSGVAGSQLLARRLSKPVEKLEVDCAENLAQRQKAEAELKVTNQELQRAARFSSDASHQLKTPVTVLRAGLDELLATNNLTDETREEVSALLHQTYRLNNIIEDLLLLSRMDAGRLKLTISSVSLKELVEGWMDDFSTLGNTAIEIEANLAPESLILGEKRYTTIIVENLLENARKYNRPGGRIRVRTDTVGKCVVLSVGNNGRTIPPEIQDHIFERFHRGTAGENVPGYGLGLNLARELARLHGGELRLISSSNDWTEFAVSFCPASVAKNLGGAIRA